MNDRSTAGDGSLLTPLGTTQEKNISLTSFGQSQSVSFTDREGKE